MQTYRFVHSLVVGSIFSTVACGGSPHLATTDATQETRSAPDGPTSLDFMLGCWRGMGTDGGVLEEHYSRLPDEIVGTSAFAQGGQVVQTETTRILLGEHPYAMIPTVNGTPSVTFNLLPMTEGRRATFENAEHDFPQRIIYAATSPDSLLARIEGTQNGDAISMEWTMTSIPCPASAAASQ